MGGGREKARKACMMIRWGFRCKVQLIKMEKEPISILVGVEFRKYPGLRETIGKLSQVFLCFRIWPT